MTVNYNNALPGTIGMPKTIGSGTTFGGPQYPSSSIQEKTQKETLEMIAKYGVSTFKINSAQPASTTNPQTDPESQYEKFVNTQRAKKAKLSPVEIPREIVPSNTGNVSVDLVHDLGQQAEFDTDDIMGIDWTVPIDNDPTFKYSKKGNPYLTINPKLYNKMKNIKRFLNVYVQLSAIEDAKESLLDIVNSSVLGISGGSSSNLASTASKSASETFAAISKLFNDIKRTIDRNNALEKEARLREANKQSKVEKNIGHHIADFFTGGKYTKSIEDKKYGGMREEIVDEFAKVNQQIKNDLGAMLSILIEKKDQDDPFAQKDEKIFGTIADNNGANLLQAAGDNGYGINYTGMNMNKTMGLVLAHTRLMNLRNVLKQVQAVKMQLAAMVLQVINNKVNVKNLKIALQQIADASKFEHAVLLMMVDQIKKSVDADKALVDAQADAKKADILSANPLWAIPFIGAPLSDAAAKALFVKEANEEGPLLDPDAARAEADKFSGTSSSGATRDDIVSQLGRQEEDLLLEFAGGINDTDNFGPNSLYTDAGNGYRLPNQQRMAEFEKKLSRIESSRSVVLSMNDEIANLNANVMSLVIGIETENFNEIVSSSVDSIAQDKKMQFELLKDTVKKKVDQIKRKRDIQIEKERAGWNAIGSIAGALIVVGLFVAGFFSGGLTWAAIPFVLAGFSAGGAAADTLYLATHQLTMKEKPHLNDKYFEKRRTQLLETGDPAADALQRIDEENQAVVDSIDTNSSIDIGNDLKVIDPLAVTSAQKKLVRLYTIELAILMAAAAKNNLNNIVLAMVAEFSATDSSDLLRNSASIRFSRYASMLDLKIEMVKENLQARNMLKKSWDEFWTSLAKTIVSAAGVGGGQLLSELIPIFAELINAGIDMYKAGSNIYSDTGETTALKARLKKDLDERLSKMDKNDPYYNLVQEENNAIMAMADDMVVDIGHGYKAPNGIKFSELQRKIDRMYQVKIVLQQIRESKAKIWQQVWSIIGAPVSSPDYSMDSLRSAEDAALKNINSIYEFADAYAERLNQIEDAWRALRMAIISVAIQLLNMANLDPGTKFSDLLGKFDEWLKEKFKVEFAKKFNEFLNEKAGPSLSRSMRQGLGIASKTLLNNPSIYSKFIDDVIDSFKKPIDVDSIKEPSIEEDENEEKAAGDGKYKAFDKMRRIRERAELFNVKSALASSIFERDYEAKEKFERIMGEMTKTILEKIWKNEINELPKFDSIDLDESDTDAVNDYGQLADDPAIKKMLASIKTKNPNNKFTIKKAGEGEKTRIDGNTIYIAKGATKNDLLKALMNFRYSGSEQNHMANAIIYGKEKRDAVYSAMYASGGGDDGVGFKAVNLLDKAIEKILSGQNIKLNPNASAEDITRAQELMDALKNTNTPEDSDRLASTLASLDKNHAKKTLSLMSVTSEKANYESVFQKYAELTLSDIGQLNNEIDEIVRNAVKQMREEEENAEQAQAEAEEKEKNVASLAEKNMTMHQKPGQATFAREIQRATSAAQTTVVEGDFTTEETTQIENEASTIPTKVKPEDKTLLNTAIGIKNRAKGAESVSVKAQDPNQQLNSLKKPIEQLLNKISAKIPETSKEVKEVLKQVLTQIKEMDFTKPEVVTKVLNQAKGIISEAKVDQKVKKVIEGKINDAVEAVENTEANAALKTDCQKVIAKIVSNAPKEEVTQLIMAKPNIADKVVKMMPVVVSNDKKIKKDQIDKVITSLNEAKEEIKDIKVKIAVDNAVKELSKEKNKERSAIAIGEDISKETMPLAAQNIPIVQIKPGQATFAREIQRATSATQTTVVEGEFTAEETTQIENEASTIPTKVKPEDKTLLNTAIGIKNRAKGAESVSVKAQDPNQQLNSLKKPIEQLLNKISAKIPETSKEVKEVLKQVLTQIKEMDFTKPEVVTKVLNQAKGIISEAKVDQKVKKVIEGKISEAVEAVENTEANVALKTDCQKVIAKIVSNAPKEEVTQLIMAKPNIADKVVKMMPVVVSNDKKIKKDQIDKVISALDNVEKETKDLRIKSAISETIKELIDSAENSEIKNIEIEVPENVKQVISKVKTGQINPKDAAKELDVVPAEIIIESLKDLEPEQAGQIIAYLDENKQKEVIQIAKDNNLLKEVINITENIIANPQTAIPGMQIQQPKATKFSSNAPVGRTTLADYSITSESEVFDTLETSEISKESSSIRANKEDRSILNAIIGIKNRAKGAESVSVKAQDPNQQLNSTKKPIELLLNKISARIPEEKKEAKEVLKQILTQIKEMDFTKPEVVVRVLNQVNELISDSNVDKKIKRIIGENIQETIDAVENTENNVSIKATAEKIISKIKSNANKAEIVQLIMAKPNIAGRVLRMIAAVNANSRNKVSLLLLTNALSEIKDNIESDPLKKEIESILDKLSEDIDLKKFEQSKTPESIIMKNHILIEYKDASAIINASVEQNAQIALSTILEARMNPSQIAKFLQNFDNDVIVYILSQLEIGDSLDVLAEIIKIFNPKSLKDLFLKLKTVKADKKLLDKLSEYIGIEDEEKSNQAIKAVVLNGQNPDQENGNNGKKYKREEVQKELVEKHEQKQGVLS